MKTLWQHENGQLYAIDHDSFGHILGAAGPIEPYTLRDLTEYRYGRGIVRWVEQAIQRNTLHRVNVPSSAR
ncbi:MAG: hypothetical protein JW955_12555 [Sedimentisphaerales bacterium]|nr:hypothetical protein [Sedimentisphaerales bacterium]